MRRSGTFFILSLLILAALACRAVQGAPEDSTRFPTATQPSATREEAVTTEVQALPTIPVSETPTAEVNPTFETSPTPAETTLVMPTMEAPPPGNKPPQSQSAEIRPAERRAELSRISAMVGFQVFDREGARLGTVSDFVINTCETYIIYFIIDLDSGERLAAPYEALTVNSGVLDAQAQAYQLSIAAKQLEEAPVFSEDQELVPTDWEEGVRAFWSQIIRLSNLTTGCRVSAPGGGTTEIHKVAYSSELIGAGLHDGLQNPLGTVEEIILSPESGKLSFFVTRLLDNTLVLVPLRVVNIPRESLGPGTEISLVLLTENERLLNAPRIGSLEEALQMQAHGAAQAHWGR